MKNKWLIMFYLAGDNSLSDDMAAGIAAMVSVAGKLNNFSLMAYYDTAAPTISTKFFDFTGNFDDQTSIEQTRDQATGDTDSGSILSIVNFVKRCAERSITNNYKFDKVALILSGHGDGFQQTSFMIDETPHSFLTVPQLKTALLSSLPLIGSKKINLLGFESCAMNSIENCTEMKDVADYLIASQGDTPNPGWSYRHIVNKLLGLDVSNDVLSEESIAKIFTESYFELNKETAKYSNLSIDLVTVKLSVVDEINEKLNDLAKLLTQKLDDPAIGYLILQLIEQSQRKAQGFLLEQYIDIWDFCDILSNNIGGTILMNEQLKSLFAKLDPATLSEDEKELIASTDEILNLKTNDPETDILLKLEAVKNTVEKACVNSDRCGAEYQFGTGLSVYFPWSLVSLKVVLPKYRLFSFARSSGADSDWVKLLSAHLIKSLREKDEVKIIIRGGGLGKPRGGGLGKPRGESGNIDFSRIKNFTLDWQ